MTVTRRRRNYPHGTAIDPDQIKCDIVPHDNNNNANKDASSSSGGPQTSDMFVTMVSLYVCFNYYLYLLYVVLTLNLFFGGMHMKSNQIHLYIPLYQCFFARLGFVQPPACLKCAYKSSQCGETNNKDDSQDSSKVVVVSSCRELVPWRRDASIPLHPDKLDGNIVFVTCDTAKSLVNGDAYPSIRWDSRNRRLLHEM